MDEISEMAWSTRPEEIERARLMSISEKFLKGAVLFEQECDAVRNEIRSRNPQWTAEEIDAELERRLEPERQSKETALALGLTP